jgi:hypothetical protein
MGGEAPTSLLLSKMLRASILLDALRLHLTAYAWLLPSVRYLMGRAFDAAGSYEAFLTQLVVLSLRRPVLLMPRALLQADRSVCTSSPEVTSST